MVRPSAAGYISAVSAVTFAVAGVGSGSLDGDAFAAPQLASPAAGLVATGNSMDVLDVLSPGLASYRLGGPVGPVSGPAIINPGTSFATSGGNLVLTSIDGLATYQAVASGVPEPSSLVLASIAGVVSQAAAKLRRGRSA